MTVYSELELRLADEPVRWCITGVAGFIGSHLLERLLRLDQQVVGCDDFSTGHKSNLDSVKCCVSAEQWARFRFEQADVREPDACRKLVAGTDHVLHQAALGSVPRSIDDPIKTNSHNISGFLNVLNACKECGVESFTYAASSSTYGDHAALPKVEEQIGNPLSPYAVTKLVNELYAAVFARCYGFKSIGLRYFNVFGPRQDPDGPYAAVIPRWIRALVTTGAATVFGDGKTSRDFCYVENVVQANILAAFAPQESKDRVYNIAVGERTTLLELFDSIRESLIESGMCRTPPELSFAEFRSGDVRHSLADISAARNAIGYEPTVRVRDGIRRTVASYRDELEDLQETKRGRGTEGV